MNDLDLVAAVRADVPEAPTARLAAGRAQLTAAIQATASADAARSRPGKMPRHGVSEAGRFHRLRPAIALPASALAAALAAAAIVAVSGGTAGHHAFSSSAELTATVLRTAATVAARRDATEPAHGQWFYRDYVDYEHGQSPAVTSDAEWITFDGVKTAYYQGARLIDHTSPRPPATRGGTALDQFDASATPLTAYRALASLPSSPAALLAVIARQAAKAGPDGDDSPIEMAAPKGPAQVEFSYLTGLLWNAACGEPPAAVASVYRAIAAIPGVTSGQGITDAAGQPALGLSDDGGITQLLLDPRTYAVIGIRSVSTGTDPAQTVTGKHGTPWPAKGDVVESIAIAQLDAVSGPGVR